MTISKLLSNPKHISFMSDSRIVQLLLDAGASVEAANHDGDHPLHLAAGAGNVEVVRLLLEAGSDLNSVGRDGNTALHAAAEMAKIEVIQELLGRGAPPAQSNSNAQCAKRGDRFKFSHCAAISVVDSS